jgi:hypothetical protein
LPFWAIRFCGIEGAYGSDTAPVGVKPPLTYDPLFLGFPKKSKDGKFSRSTGIIRKLAICAESGLKVLVLIGMVLSRLSVPANVQPLPVVSLVPLALSEIL